MLVRTILVALAVALSASSPLQAGNFGEQGRGYGRSPARPVQPLTVYVAPTAVEAADMLYMREEEKLARDVYLAMDDAWGLVPFANVAASEQKHMDAMLKLLLKYRLPDPAAGNAIGEFTDPDLQKLYDKLVDKGLKAPDEALLVGGLIEEVDMVDIQSAIEASTKDDIDAVYASLMCGSRNHLRAFAGAYEALTGKDYKAQLLPQAAVDAILAVPSERCGRK
jgi:hypothetical protein